MRRLTLLELIVCLAVIALLAALLTPAVARLPNARRPTSEVVPATVTAIAGGLAVAGAVWLAAWHAVRWLRARFRPGEPVAPGEPRHAEPGAATG